MPLFYSLQLLSLGSIGPETAHVNSQAMITKLNPSAPTSFKQCERYQKEKEQAQRADATVPIRRGNYEKSTKLPI
jgi:hypothetical protein